MLWIRYDAQISDEALRPCSLSTADLGPWALYGQWRLGSRYGLLAVGELRRGLFITHVVQLFPWVRRVSMDRVTINGSGKVWCQFMQVTSLILCRTVYFITSSFV